MDSSDWESSTTDTRSGAVDDFVSQGTPSDAAAHASSYHVDTDFDPRSWDPADDSSAGAEPTHEPTLELDEPDATDDAVELGTETHTAVPWRDPSWSETPPPVTPLATPTRDAARGLRWRRWGPVVLAGAAATATLVAWLLVGGRGDRAAGVTEVDEAPPAAVGAQPVPDEPAVTPIADLAAVQEPSPAPAAASASAAAVRRAVAAPRPAALPVKTTLFPPRRPRQTPARQTPTRQTPARQTPTRQTPTRQTPAHPPTASPSRASTPEKAKPTRLNLPGSGL